VHGRHMHADLFEETPAHHAGDAAALVGDAVAAPPRRPHEATGRARIERGRRLIFQRLERRANLVAQLLEPSLRPGFAFLAHVRTSPRPRFAALPRSAPPPPRPR